MNNRIGFAVFLFMLSAGGSAQKIDPVQESYINNVIEAVSERYENTAEISTIFDDLYNYTLNPLNLNTATAEQLTELHVLNAFQIASLLDYRKTHGKILTVHELGYIPGFRQIEADLISPFVYCGEIGKNVYPGSPFLPVKHQIISRYQRVLESAYYDDIADSLRGSLDKLYIRYNAKIGSVLKTGVLAEKDPEEQFFRGSNRHGFDFYSAFISYENRKKFLKKIILGDYHVNIAQGLLSHSSYSMGKATGNHVFSSLKENIKPNTSADENHFYRGTAVTIQHGNYESIIFFSHHLIDASPSTDSSDIEGFLNTGHHVTASELMKENFLKVTTSGGNIKYLGDRFRSGLNFLYFRTDKHLLPGEKLYESFSFSGNEYYGFSFDYRYLARKYTIAGEAACSYNAPAFINSILFYLKPELSLGFLHRYYDKGYYSYWADAFSENTNVSNENGFFASLEGSYSKTSFRFQADIFSFPWLRYRVNVPSSGYEILGEWQQKIGRCRINVYYKRQEKPVNRNIPGKIYDVQPAISEHYRLKSLIPLGTYIIFQERIDITRAGFMDNPLKTGILLLQDISFRSLPFPVDADLRIAWFNTDDYDTRIYAYERDLLHTAGSQMFYRKGWRYMAMVKWKITEKIDFWIKLGQTRYFQDEQREDEVTDHRSEVKMQLILKL